MTGDTLFDVVATDAPRCRMCTRPAHRTAAGIVLTYCSSSGCKNRERLCQACGGLFLMGVDGAGTKYCSSACKVQGWRQPQPRTFCAWCERPNPDRYRNRSGIWPYICSECVAPIRHLADRLKSHHVTHEQARRLLDDPGCEVCGRDIVAKYRRSDGKVRARLVVDHDHSCCPGEKSCGRCVRGLLCSQCNAAAGMLGEDPAVAQQLAGYMARHSQAAPQRASRHAEGTA